MGYIIRLPITFISCRYPTPMYSHLTYGYSAHGMLNQLRSMYMHCVHLL